MAERNFTDDDNNSFISYKDILDKLQLHDLIEISGHPYKNRLVMYIGNNRAVQFSPIGHQNEEITLHLIEEQFVKGHVTMTDLSTVVGTSLVRVHNKADTFEKLYTQHLAIELRTPDEIETIVNNILKNPPPVVKPNFPYSALYFNSEHFVMYLKYKNKFNSPSTTPQFRKMMTIFGTAGRAIIFSNPVNSRLTQMDENYSGKGIREKLINFMADLQWAENLDAISTRREPQRIVDAKMVDENWDTCKKFISRLSNEILQPIQKKTKEN